MIAFTFDCTSEVSFVFEMTYRLNFDLLSYLQKLFESLLKENFQSYLKNLWFNLKKKIVYAIHFVCH